MIPLYGFLQGDTIGLLVLAQATDSVQALRERLKESAAIRVKPKDGGQVIVKNRIMPLAASVEASGLEPLDRFDVVWS